MRVAVLSAGCGVTLYTAGMAGLVVFLAISAAAAVAVISAVVLHHVLHPPRHTAAYALRRGWPIDPAAAGIAFEEWSDTAGGGASIAVWDIAPGAPVAGGPGSVARNGGQAVSALAIHGWGESRIDLLALMRGFLNHFDRVLMVDRAGHGESTGMARLGDLSEVRVIESIASQLQDAPFFLVASGSGAGLAGPFATHCEGPRPRGIILINAIDDDIAAITDDLRSKRWPVRPFLDLALLVLRAKGIQPRRSRPEALPGDLPVLHISLNRNEQLPDGELGRIREWMSDGCHSRNERE